MVNKNIISIKNKFKYQSQILIKLEKLRINKKINEIEIYIIQNKLKIFKIK